MNKLYILIGGLTALIAALWLGVVEGRPPKIILDHADTLRNQGDVRFLIGNVRLRRGAAKLQAERAYHNARTGLVDLSGSVVLQEPGRKISAAQMCYYEPTGDFEAYGNIDFIQADSVRIRAQRARYYEEFNRLDLFDQVIVHSLSDGAYITGRRARWERGQDLAVVEGDPIYRLPDREAEPPDTLVIKSEQVTYYKNTRAALFAGEVELSRRDLFSVSDTLFYQPDSNRTILSGAPVIWYKQDELSGRYMEFVFIEHKIKSILVKQEALALTQSSEDPELNNRLKGGGMTIAMVNDSSRIALVTGDAEGEYHIFNEKGVYQGLNVSRADTIEITIVSNKATRIKLAGQTLGEFYPPDQIPMEFRQPTKTSAPMSDQ